MSLTRRITALALSGGMVLLLLSSCASFPRPASASDTLLVIPVQLKQEASGGTFGQAKITIENMSDRSIQRVVQTGPWAKMVFVRGLAPGFYRITKQQFIYDNLHPGSVWHPNLTFVLEAGRITIPSRILTYTLYKPAGDSRTWIRTNWFPLTVDEATPLLRELRSKDNFRAWQLSDVTAGMQPIREAEARLGGS